MGLSDFRLPEKQADGEFVDVLADDGETRVVARLPRSALEDYFGRASLTPGQRAAVVAGNLPQIGAVIGRKYLAREFGPYMNSWGAVEDTCCLIVVTLRDLQSGPHLSDARLVMEEGSGFGGQVSPSLGS